MKLKETKIMFIILILAFTLIISGCSTENNQSTENTIKIGAISALTGSASIYGEPGGKAVLLAADIINNNGGILGKQVEIILEDGMCDATTTANAVNKLVYMDKVQVILGGHCSTESLTIAPIANENKVIQLASITSSDKYTDAGDYSFRNWPSSNYYVAKSADIAYEKGTRNIALFYEQKDFPAGAAYSFRDRAEELGANIVTEQAFLSTETDYRSYLTKIKSEENVDTIFFSCQGEACAIQYFKTLKELDMLDSYILFTNNDPISKNIYEKTGGLNKNVYATDTYVNVDTNPKAKEMLELYKEKFGEYPQATNFQVACSYDALFTIKDAIESCGNVDTNCIKQFLYELEDWEGAAGKLSFDENGDPITTIGLHYFDNDGNEIWEEI